MISEDRLPQAPAGIPSPAVADYLQTHEKTRIRAAARHARRVYPGDVGELLFRELEAFANFGVRWAVDGLIPRLATAILATPPPERAEPELSPRVAELIAEAEAS